MTTAHKFDDSPANNGSYFQYFNNEFSEVKSLGGEECGLYGSKHYCKHPLFPIEKTKMMMNLDMVGNGTSFFVEGGKTHAELFKHFETANSNFIHRNLGASASRKNYG